jgi:hypothetical protein
MHRPCARAPRGASAPVHAETRRIAVVIGSNRGEATHAPLRFAEQDATKLAAVLTELGGLTSSDMLLLRGPKVVEVRAALDEATRRIALWHKDNRGQVVLIFYFSGHSDGSVLELAGQGLPFAELRRRVTDTGADVRLVILDSCRSGALLALKGGTLGQPFDIRLADDLASTGEAMIASSAADEAALESSENRSLVLLASLDLGTARRCGFVRRWPGDPGRGLSIRIRADLADNLGNHGGPPASGLRLPPGRSGRPRAHPIAATFRGAGSSREFRSSLAGVDPQGTGAGRAWSAFGASNRGAVRQLPIACLAGNANLRRTCDPGARARVAFGGQRIRPDAFRERGCQG